MLGYFITKCLYSIALQVFDKMPSRVEKFYLHVDYGISVFFFSLVDLEMLNFTSFFPCFNQIRRK